MKKYNSPELDLILINGGKFMQLNSNSEVSNSPQLSRGQNGTQSLQKKEENKLIDLI